MLRACISIAVTLSLAGAALAQAPHSHRHRFEDAERWSKVFDDPARDAWQKPQAVIDALAPAADAVIADIGAGTGYFAVRFARRVPQGRVYGADTEADMVRFLAERARREGLPNLVAVAAAPADPRLPEKADFIVLVDVYHHIEARERYFARLRESLRPGGRVVVIDFTLDSPVGPPRAARVEPARVLAEMQRAGYRLEREHGFLPNQYFLVFRPGQS